ncbi:MAG TPA: sugar kinase [Candidatus Omnitrophota bacterium]|nr:sugar kinase [Candidatus Omnitrophota bacterium]HPS20098.1 sugar kinase [Candidatus Omnitrophota bacterium]
MIISRAPVRLSMGGGGTDIPYYYEKYGGFLMAAAINKYIYVIVNKRFYDSICLSYSKTEIVDDINKIEHGIFREALRYVDIKSGIELVSMADVPARCGLGTSSAFTVSLLNGLLSYKKIRTKSADLAEKACHIEIDVLKEPIGKQDQYASAFGGFRAYWFEKDGTVRVEKVRIKADKLEKLEKNILLFNLNKERSAGGVLEAHGKKAKAGDVATLERLHKIKELGLRTKKIFESGKIDEFGEILHEHWLTKKQLSSKISDTLIDEAYDLARANGAIGGKVVGAGGGGFLLLYCPDGKEKLISVMGKINLGYMPFLFETEGAKIVFKD